MRRGWKRAFSVLAFATGGLAGFVLVLFGLANIGPGQDAIAFLVDRISGGDVQIRGLRGRFPDSLRAAHVDIADSKGIWLSIDDVRVDWAPLALLSRRVDVSRLDAERAGLLRLPADEDQSQSNYRFDIRAFHVGRLVTSADVSGMAAELTADGRVTYLSRQDISADLTATRLDAPGSYRVNARWKNGVIGGTASISEGAQGALAGLIGWDEIGPIAIEARASGPATANAVSFTLQAGPLSASGRGIVALPARRVDIDVTANAPAMTLRADLSLQSLVLDAHIHGQFDSPDVTAHFEIRNLRGADSAVERLAADANGNAGALDFTATATGLQLPGFEPNFFGRAPVALKGHAELQGASRPVSFTLSHPMIAAQGQFTLGDRKAGSATITLPRLGPFAARAGIDMEGRASLTANVSVTDRGTQIALDGRIDAAGGASSLSGLLGRNARLGLSAIVKAADISISEARLDGDALNARLTGTIRNRELDLDGTIALADLTRLTSAVSGDVRIAARARGPIGRARLDGSATGNIASEGFAKQRVTLAFTATGLPRPSSGDFRGSGSFDGAPVAVNGTFGWNRGVLQLAVARGQWKSLSARASFAIPDSGSASGRANIRLERLEDASPFIGQKVTGSLEATLDVRPRNGLPGADVSATVRDAEMANISVRALTIKGSVVAPLDKAMLALNLAASGIEARGVSGNATARLEGPLDALVVHLDSDVQTPDGIPATLSAIATLNTGDKRLRLSSLSGNYRGRKASLTAPATLRFDQGVAVDRFTARSGEAELTLAGRVSPTLDVTASVRNVTSELVGDLIPQWSEGTLSGTAILTGTLDAPRGILTLAGRGLRPRDASALLAPASLEASGALQQESIAVHGTIEAGTFVHLLIEGDLPLKGTGTLDMRASGNADLAMFAPILASEGTSLTGALALNASLKGTLAKPVIAGTAQLTGGDYQDFPRGLRIRDMSASAESRDNIVRITKFSGRAGPGTVTGEGTLDILSRGTPIDFTLEARNARPLASDRLTATMDAKLKLTGTLRERLSVSGSMNISRGEINLPDSFPPDVAVLNVIHPGRGTPPLDAAPSPLVTNLDVTVTAPGQFFVRGRGLDAEVQGNFHAGGTDRAPDITGGFTLRRGTLSLAGQTLDFTSGRVSFDGTGLRHRLDPTLDFTAETVSNNVTARIRVTGYASAPAIQLSSTPALPQDEVLARLLFGQSVNQLSPFQLAQIAQAAASLGGVGSGFDPVATIRKSLGLDRLSVAGATSAGTTQTSVEAGKYVARNVYVGARQSLSGGTAAQVQVDLTRNLKAQATVNTGANATITKGSAQRDTGSSIGLSYQFEY